MQERDELHIAVVGSGFMGLGIAQVSALAGHKTTVIKATPGSVDEARERLNETFQRAVQRGKLDKVIADQALARLEFTTTLETATSADLVIESVIEDLKVKQELFAKLTRLTDPDTILASNTSTLKISELAAPAARDRTIGLHFFSPVPAMKLVEVARLRETRPELLERAEAFVAGLGKTAVPVLDSTGFIVNRLLLPYLLGAIAAFEEGLATAEQIDTAMKLGCSHPMGPLALADLIGLDVVFAMAKLLHREFNDSRYHPPALLRRMVQDGQLGRKSGSGFYDYGQKPPVPNPGLWDLVSGTRMKAAS
jgi:3-hydroxybutyryl-CoA dehydrogenase